MKLLVLMTFLSFNINADIVKRPAYQPDENHPAPSMTPRQAQEEKIEQRSKKNVKQLKGEKEKIRRNFERFKESEMTE